MVFAQGLGLRQQWVSAAGAQRSEGPEKKMVAGPWSQVDLSWDQLWAFLPRLNQLEGNGQQCAGPSKLMRSE